jgi:SAM-dependent methyltransferase
MRKSSFVPETQPDDEITRNVRAHDARTAVYERQHGEIFNPIEQDRLHTQLGTALSEIRTGTSGPHALDFGCGSGNLTAHLLRLGCRVTSADVSPRFLERIQLKFGPSGRCDVLQLTGRGNDLATGGFDLVGVYSVLHHVPDYVTTVKELMRSLRPGGVLFIDHESSPSAWRPDAERDAWHKNGRRRVPWLRERLELAMSLSWYAYRLRRLRDPHASLEGDIHVWQDDHIEWDRVESAVREEGGRSLHVIDYLLYRRSYGAQAYERYRRLCEDTRCFIARKERIA